MSLFKKEKQEEITPKNITKKMQSLEVKLKAAIEEIEQLKEKSQQTITKIEVIRFNPFKEVGGDQSFCVALLNEKENGVIITSYYGRDLNRVYAKEIKGGTSQYDLSEEEKEVIQKAIHGEPKS